MNKPLFPILVLCLAAWLFGGAAWFGKHFQLPQDDTTWILEDGGHTFTASNKIAFSLNSRDLLTNASQDSLISAVSSYLALHPDRNLRLTGLYAEEEVNNSEATNLGIARAESVRNYIYRSGKIDLDRIVIDHQKVDKHAINAYGLVDGGVRFEFFESPLAVYGPAFQLRKEFFYADPDAALIDESQSFKQYLEALRQYLADHPQDQVYLKLYFTGLTKEETDVLRMTQIQNQLVDINIPKNRMQEDFESLGIASDEKEIDGYLEIEIY